MEYKLVRRLKESEVLEPGKTYRFIFGVTPAMTIADVPKVAKMIKESPILKELEIEQITTDRARFWLVIYATVKKTTNLGAVPLVVIGVLIAITVIVATIGLSIAARSADEVVKVITHVERSVKWLMIGTIAVCTVIAIGYIIKVVPKRKAIGG